MKRRFVFGAAAVVGLAAVVLGYGIGRARASGIPLTNTLTYTGTLLNNGQADNGTHFVIAKVFDGTGDGGVTATQACQTTTGTVTAANGRFTIALDPSCVAAVHASPNLSIDLTIDGIDVGSSPLTAVPYAVEADTASKYAPGSQIASLVPPGTVVAYAGVVSAMVAPPPGWLLCDGSTKSRGVYANLFTSIGTTAGAGDGATTFNLPNYQGYFLRGLDPTGTIDPDANSRVVENTGGNTGATVGTLELDGFASHTHGFISPALSASGTAIGAYQAGNSGALEVQYTTAAAGGTTETRPKNVAVNYIIKY
jgi:microcystin-dependent protein